MINESCEKYNFAFESMLHSFQHGRENDNYTMQIHYKNMSVHNHFFTSISFCFNISLLFKSI